MYTAILATGTFQNAIGDNMGLHTSTISRIVKKVLHSVAALAVNEVKMPVSPEEIAHVEQEFMGMYCFPHVIGCIVGAHITIQSPGGDNAQSYRNRKGIFPIMCRWYVILALRLEVLMPAGQDLHTIVL
ncbi:hypothetical protein QE152_g4894 [Popillia japonica]|uniref:Nuclease HARBI1 n=1 Tax=Popillia japonica TaxID=7064 RepID=A0AAW1MYN7_POPJA